MKIGSKFVKSEERRRQVWLFYGYTGAVTVVEVVEGLYHYLGHYPMAIAILSLGGALSLLINAALLRYHRDVNLADHVFLVSSAITVIGIIPFGGVANSLILWLFTFPAAAFMLVGLRSGLYYNLTMMVGVTAIALSQLFGMIHTSYEHIYYLQVLFVLGLITAFSYVSERAQRRFLEIIGANNDRLRIILAQLPVGVVVINRIGGVSIIANSNAHRLLGRSIGDSIEPRDFVTVMELKQENGEPYPIDKFPLNKVLDGERVSIENNVFVHHADGTRLALRFAGASIRGVGGEIISAVIVFEDMTSEFEIDKMKSDFVSLASHQLKTPLTSLRWTVESLRDESAGFSEEQRVMLGDAQEITSRLIRLVSDLLNVSRIEAGSKFFVEPVPTNVVQPIKEAVHEFETQARQRGLKLSLESLPEKFMCLADTHKLKEALMNLIGNAVKYSRENGRVEVGIRNVGEAGAAIFVKDSGIGIPADEQARIFSKFFRATNANQHEGTGLGLYIVKAIIEKHGGHIWFESEQNRGTTFYISLPGVKPLLEKR